MTTFNVLKPCTFHLRALNIHTNTTNPQRTGVVEKWIITQTIKDTKSESRIGRNYEWWHDEQTKYGGCPAELIHLPCSSPRSCGH